MPGKKPTEIDPERGERIKSLREKKGLSQAGLGSEIGVSRAAVSLIEAGKAFTIDNALKISGVLGVSLDYLLTGVNNTLHPVNKEEVAEPRGKVQVNEAHPVLVTVDHTLNEVITFVPTRAQAGYLVGYGDPEFIHELPAFGFPGFNHGIFRAFEVQGYSMLQYEGAGLYPSDIVIAQYVESPAQIKDNRVYVVASDEGLLIKRCVNRLESASKLICNSDNKNGDYPPIILDRDQIKEVWEFKGKFSRQIPKATRVFDEITELQTQLTLMADQLRETTQRVDRLANEKSKQ